MLIFQMDWQTGNEYEHSLFVFIQKKKLCNPGAIEKRAYSNTPLLGIRVVHG